MVAAAKEAGAAIQQVSAAGFEVTQKGRAGPVTEADRRADALLKDRLLSLESAAWLSEETADDRTRLSTRRAWVVDPLDGTKEFIRGLPEYAVAIALVVDDEPVLGVVHNPATGQTFSASQGAGATLNGISCTVRGGDVMLASRSELEGGEFEPFADEWTITPVGSIQYKLGLIAAGKGAVTVSRGPKHEWDVAAGAIIVAEAGGIVSDLAGRKLRFNQPFPKVPGIIAGSPEAYRRVHALIQRVGASPRMSELEKRG